MARKRSTPPAPPTPTAERVDAAVRKGDLTTAVDLVRRLVQLDPKPHHQHLHVETLFKAAEHYINANQELDARIALAETERYPFDEPAVRERLALTYARTGHLRRASELIDPAQLPKVLAHHTDWVMRTRNRTLLPEPLHAAFDAVTTAFLHYHAGRDDAAREALNAIGLSSPFLEWKVLLRGLIAWSNNDDARAVENFARLSLDRIPHRLAKPILSRIDPEFAAKNQSTDGVNQYRLLTASGLAERLRKVQQELAGKKKLGAAFKAVEAAVPQLKTHAPTAVPRLANAFYFAIIKQGDQEDLNRYRKLFGHPADDPSFNKLEARVYEEIDAPEEALQRWSAHEGWLSTLPNGWPKPLADRARAMILQIMGDIASDLEEGANDPDAFDGFPGFFGAPSRKKAPKKKPIDPAIYWRRATELAPDWEKPARDLFERAVDTDQTAEAEVIARKHFAHNPQSVQVLNALSRLVLKQGRTADSLELRGKLLALNPLDKLNRHAMAEAVVAHARKIGIDGKPADALATLDQNRELVRTEMAMSDHALRATLHRKLKDVVKADEHAVAGLALPSSRLTMRLYLQANAVLLKLKPAEKTAAGKAFTAALVEPPNPADVLNLLVGWDMFHSEGLTYTGQKTQEKKLLDAIVRAVDGTGTEVEFEGLPIILASRGQFPLIKKIAPKLMKRFPKNPVFPYFLGEAESQKGPGYKALEPLRKAKVLAEASTEERHKHYLPRIEDLLKLMNPFGGLFGRFFGGEGGYDGF